MATFIPNVTDVFPEPALFTPDFSFMDKMLQRRQSMYDQGWSQVNAAYNFVNKELTNPQNIKDRDIFLMQAKNNLKNLAGVDLSQHQNVMAANGVFQPWANNEKALGDASLTSHWKQQEAIGDGYRLEDGGKYFNQANVDYIRKQRAAFAGDAAESWGDYWKSKRSYTPYYDYHKEVQDLMKDFKPSSYKIDKVKGLYKYTDENASWTQAEIRKYLEANLSDKAKQQMKIEGDVLYNTDPKQMGQTYISIAKDEMQQYDDGITFYNKKLSSATKPEEIQKYKEYISNFQDRKKELGTNIDAINKGDYTYIKKRGEDIALNIFFNKFMNKVSNGWSHADITHKIDGDEVGLTIYREAAADTRQLRGFQHDIDMARMKGEIGGPAQQNEIQINDNAEVSLTSLNKDVDDVHAKQVDLTNMNKGMIAAWKQSLPENKGKTITINDVRDEDIIKFKNEGYNGKALPPTHPFRTNELSLTKLELQEKAVRKRLDDATEAVKAGYTDEQKKQLQNATANVNNLGSLKLSSGIEISAKDVLNALNSDPKAVSYGAWGAGVGDVTLKINGKTYSPFNDGKHGEQDVIRFANFVNSVKKTRNDQDIFKKYDKDVNTYFEKHQAELKNVAANVLTFDPKSYEAKSLEGEMHNIFPEAQYSIQHAGIGSDPTNQGNAYFYITPKQGTDASSTDIIKYLQARGYKDVIERPQAGGATLYEIKNYKSPIISQYNQYNDIEKLILTDLSKSSFTNGTGKYQSALYTSKSDRRLMIERDHNMYYLYVEGLNDNSSIMEKWPNPFYNANDAILQGQVLTSPNSRGLPEAQLQAYQSLLNK